MAEDDDNIVASLAVLLIGAHIGTVVLVSKNWFVNLSVESP